MEVVMSKAWKEWSLYMFYWVMFCVIGFSYLGIVLAVEERTHGAWNMVFFFAALWLPIRLDGYLPKEWRRESWADNKDMKVL
jgi:hypothetical protein